MLSDENRLPTTLNIAEQLGGLSLEGGNEFRTHRVILKYHCFKRKGSVAQLFIGSVHQISYVDKDV